MNYIQSAPKAELHVHLEGSGSLRYWENNFPELFKEIKNFLTLEKKSLPIFLQCMEKIHRALRTPEHYYDICVDFLDQAIKENIRYVEITWAPGGIWEFHKISPELAFQAISRAIYEKRYFIEARVLIDIIRNQPLCVADMIINWLKSYMPKEVVGINFGGDEGKYTVDPFIPIFSEAKSIGLGVSIHAGESIKEEKLMEAVRLVNPDRIGHATSLRSKNNIEEIVRKNIHIEASPKSNQALGYIENISDHPIIRHKHINASLNTDDRTFFSKSLTEEIENLLSINALDIYDVARFQIHAANSSFAKDNPLGLQKVINYWSNFNG